MASGEWAFLTYLATPGLFSKGRWYPTELTKTEIWFPLSPVPRARRVLGCCGGPPAEDAFVSSWPGLVYFGRL